MNDEVRKELVKLVATYGTELSTDIRKTEGLLRDKCGNHKLEIAVLVSAMRHKIPEEINAKVDSIDQLQFSRFVKRLQENEGTVEVYAKWAIESWVVALGKETETNRGTIPQLKRIKYEQEAIRQKEEEIKYPKNVIPSNIFSYQTKITNKCAENGQHDVNSQLLYQVFVAVNAFEYTLEKATALRDIAIKYAEDGQFDEAIKTVNTISYAYHKVKVLGEIAGNIIAIENLKQKRNCIELLNGARMATCRHMRIERVW